MSITQMAIDAMLAILFGILTLLATVAGIRYKDSICDMIVRFSQEDGDGEVSIFKLRT
jgi:hypothetical protein